ncbi:early endosome antigen 1-like isoform X1 [Canna indica]|uniref:Early endosome antigen 1-like isoform X1 n=1 Tax=Canna indica TaxID=4628 RepID=A0AAQ3K1D2_9LILI|nr:early endosome antigen 1-like isoform X1 [Canna indica]
MRASLPESLGSSTCTSSTSVFAGREPPEGPKPRAPQWRALGFHLEEAEEEGVRKGENMFKLHRHRSDRFGEKVEFKISNLQAIKVPKGWDKLFLSIVSVESGKTIVKTGKATVRSGNCQWTETESIWVSQDDTTKELEECQFKIVVSPASIRSSIIGEVTLNLEDHLSAGEAGPLFLPLNKCDSGTTLQVKIQCCSPNSRFRDGKSWKETSHLDQNNNDELDISDGSDNIFNRSINSSSSDHFGNPSYPDESGNRVTSFSASGSQRTSDSGHSLGRTKFSPGNSLNGEQYSGKQDSSGSHTSPTQGTHPRDEVSNRSFFNSRTSGSSVHNNQLQDMTAQTNENGTVKPSSDTSKDLLAAVEEIEELRGEVKMWERHSQQLKVHLANLKKENSKKSKHQEELDRQLSTVYNERTSLKLEVEQLKSVLEESMSKQTDVSSLKTEDMIRLQELEDELKLQKDTNADLTQQLGKAQESNIELVSILQELEEITEQQRLEIINLSQQSCLDEHDGQERSQKSLDNKAHWEREILSSRDQSDSIREVEMLKNKVEELEKDCAELTEENLDLLYKLKELSKDSEKGSHLHGALNEFDYQMSSSNSHHENASLKNQVHELEDELRRKSAMITALSDKFKDLEKASGDLEIEVQHYKDEASDLERKLYQRHQELEDKNIELAVLQQKLKLSLGTDMDGLNDTAMTGSKKLETFCLSDMQNVLSEMDKQIHLALAQAKNLNSNDSSNEENMSGTDADFSSPSTDLVSQKNQVEDIARNLHELNTLLRENVSRYNSTSHHQSSKIQEPEKAGKKTKGGGNIEDGCQAILLLKEQEIDRLQYSNKELEDLICNIQKEKCKLEEDLACLSRENNEMSKILEDVEHDLEEVTGSMEFYISTNKTLEKKSAELGNHKCELELHVYELEQESIELSERVSDLEAQLRYVTNEKESNRLELEDTRSLVADLKDEVEKQKGEMEMQREELKQKLQEAEKRVSEALEESNISRRSNSKLQATTESLIEECSSLQKLTADLKKQKLELHEHITRLEIELNESKKKNFDFSEQVEYLEVKLSSLLRDIASKAKSISSQFEQIFQDHKEHGERIEMAKVLLNKIKFETTVEVENLEIKLANLTAQMSSSHDEREKLALDVVHEASVLRSEKARLECSLQEIISKAELYETDLQTLQKESKNKSQGLVDLLNASKQSEEMLVAEIEHLKRIMDGVRSSEEKHRKIANDLELKHKTSEYEKQQLVEEISELKFQLQKLSQLQNPAIDLESSLDEANCEKQKLEEELKSVTKTLEELKAEKVCLIEKLSNIQKALSDGEDDTCKIALQEKLWKLESDPSVKEASCVCETELKNELNRIKRTNSEYQGKVQNLEEEVLKLREKVKIMEIELMVRKTSQDENISSEGDKKSYGLTEVPNGNKEVDHQLEILGTGNTKFLDENSTCEEQLKGVDCDNQEVLNENSDKISSLETELRDMKERYLHMSLQYAEVEAQREELVMQLKSVKKEKRWFS